MKILKINEHSEKEIVKQTVEVLKNGGIVIFPTETIYGIGVDPTNEEAVKKLFKYKSRREGKPISIAVTDKEMASKYVELNDMAENLYDNYLPGPITVVSKNLGNVAPGIGSEFGTLGIRIPDYPLILEIVKSFGGPMTSTSANASYQPKPYSIEGLFKHLSQKQKDLIDLVIDAGELPKNEPSSVVDTTMNTLNVLREGKLKFNEDLKKENILIKGLTNVTEETVNMGGMAMLKTLDLLLENAVVFALSGEMGAGKTQFVKGIAKQLGIHEIIKSPTYTFLEEYDYTRGVGSGKLVHIDTWRFNEPKEVATIGLEEYLVPRNVIAIEWADKYYEELMKLMNGKKVQLFKVAIEYKSADKREVIVYNS